MTCIAINTCICLTLGVCFLQVQYGAYVGVGGISNIFKLVFAGLMFFILVKFSFGRNLLSKVKHTVSCCESYGIFNAKTLHLI